jgi:pyridoxamine 5'-phosphate oxidase
VGEPGGLGVVGEPGGLGALRARFDAEGLEPRDLDADPIVACRAWIDDARAAGMFEPDAMSLATVDAGGSPTVRAVLLRGLDARGFVFFTNYTSAKGQALDASGVASLHFLWTAMRRQIRVDGLVQRTTVHESDAYFASRPRDRQIAAWSSDQSAVVASRAELDDEYAAVSARFAGGDVPRPPHWGGYRVVPERIEFWQGRETRLHDRLRYERSAGEWSVSRLAP